MFSIASGGLTFDPATPQRTSSDATSIGPWGASLFVTSSGVLKLSDPDGSTLQVPNASGLAPYQTGSFLNLTIFNHTGAALNSIRVELRTTATTPSTPGDGVSFGQDLAPPSTAIGSTIITSTLAKGPGDVLLFSSIRNGLGLPNGQAIGLVFPVTSTLPVGPAEIYLSITPNPGPPVIVTQPLSQVVSPGAGVVFTVTASSATPMTFQWRRSGVAVAGATAASFSIASVTTANAGSYSVDVTNGDGTTASSAAVLTVAPPISPGFFLGTFGGQGAWGLQFRADQTGAFVGFDRSSNTAFFQSILWKSDGTFTDDPAGNKQPLPGDPRGAQISGTVVAGRVSGQLVGLNLAFAADRDADAGPASLLSGLYVARALGTASGFGYAMVGPSGQIAVLTLAPGFADGVLGTISTTGALSATSPAGSQLEISVNGALRTFEATVRPAGIVAPLAFLGMAEGTAATSRLVNLSILTEIASQGDKFTLGTVIGGARTTGSKPLLVRAGGPALSAIGVPGAISDPRLDVFSGQTVIATNDNWGGTPLLVGLFNQVGAFGFPGPNSLDAAAATGALAPGNYTVEVAGVGSATGAVIAELYDAGQPGGAAVTAPRLVNVSVLKPVRAGEFLTAGFVIGGTGPKQVLVRAVGPTLGQAPFNVPSVMPDPRVELFSGQTSISANDNWGGTAALAAAAQGVGAFSLPPTSRDAVLLAVLRPGNYTAQVGGGAAGGGNVLVEVYEVP